MRLWILAAQHYPGSRPTSRQTSPCRTLAVQDAQDLAQPLADMAKVAFSGRRRQRKGQGVLPVLRLRAQLLARPRNGKAFVIKQLLDAENVLHVGAAVGSLPGVALGRL